MHILNNFVTAQRFVLLLFYTDVERVISMRSGNSELAYLRLIQRVIFGNFAKIGKAAWVSPIWQNFQTSRVLLTSKL